MFSFMMPVSPLPFYLKFPPTPTKAPLKVKGALDGASDFFKEALHSFAQNRSYLDFALADKDLLPINIIILFSN